MAVSSSPSPLTTPKAQPDVAKLKGWESIELIVNKLRGNKSTLVVPPTKVNYEKVRDLLTTLPAQHGPGLYRFDATDANGNEKDVWQTQLGVVADDDGPQQIYPSNNGVSGGASSTSVPVSSGVRHIGRGCTWDPETNILLTPSGQMHLWQPGQDLPAEVRGVAPTASATPWASAGPVQGGNLGWGQMPAQGGSPSGSSSNNSEVQALREQLAELERTRTEERHRSEMDALRADMRASQEAINSRFEKLIEAVSKKDDGPDPRMAALEKQLEDERRRAEQQQFQAALKSQEDRTERMINELKNAGPDPAVTMLTQLVQSIQASTQAMMGMMEKSAAQQAEAGRENMRLVTERFGSSALTPERMLQMMSMVQEAGKSNDVLNDRMMQSMRQVFDMQQELVRMQMEMGGPSEPSWLSALREGMGGVSKAAQAYMMKNNSGGGAATDDDDEAVTEARQVAEKWHGTAVQQQQQLRAQAAELARLKTQIASGRAHGEDGEAASPVPAPAKEDPLRAPSISEREAAAEQIFGPPRPDPMPQIPQPGTPPPAEAEIVADQEDAAPTPEVEQVPAQEVEVVTTDGTVAADPKAQNIGDMPPEVVREAVKQFKDPVFFGPFYDKIKELRAEVKKGECNAKQAAAYILAARQFFDAIGTDPPPAMELMVFEHYEVLCERIFPKAAKKFINECVTEIDRLLDLEDSAEDGEGNEPATEDLA